jgi:hypothetical protein
MAQSEFDRKIEIITGILADLTVKQQIADEHINDWKERMDRADERMAGVDARMERADRRMTRVEDILKLAIRAGRRERREWREKYAALVDAQMRSEAKLARTEEAVNRLAEAQVHSDRKFEAFMDTVRQDVERRRGRRGEEAKDEGDGGESQES